MCKNCVWNRNKFTLWALLLFPFFNEKEAGAAVQDVQLVQVMCGGPPGAAKYTPPPPPEGNKQANMERNMGE